MAKSDNEGRRKGFWHRRKDAEVVVEQVEGDLSAATAETPADAAPSTAAEPTTDASATVEQTTPATAATEPTVDAEQAEPAGPAESAEQPGTPEQAEQSGHVLTGFTPSATPPETRPVYDAGQAAADAARIQKAVRVARPAGVPDPLPETDSKSAGGAGIAPLPTGAAQQTPEAQPEAQAQPQPPTQPNPTAAEEAALGAQIAKAVEPAAPSAATPATTAPAAPESAPAEAAAPTAAPTAEAPAAETPAAEASAAETPAADVPAVADDSSDGTAAAADTAAGPSPQASTAVLAQTAETPETTAPAEPVAAASEEAGRAAAAPEAAAQVEATALETAAAQSPVAAAAAAAAAEQAAIEAENAVAHAHPLVVTPVRLEDEAAPIEPAETVAPLITERNVTVSGLRRAFGRRNVVLDGVSFTARSGQVTAIVGPNGSGKTTLLQILATVLRPQEGDVRINGIDAVVRPQDVRTSIGWLTDTVAVWPRLTVRKTLMAFSRLYGYSRGESRTRVDELLAALDLTDRAKTPARQLSRGERQLLGLARALVHDPQVLLLDEPTEALDATHRTLVLNLIRGLAGEGKTVIVATHDFDQLDACADNVVYLHDGRTATADEVARAQSLPRLWRIKSLDPAALLDALQRFDVEFSVDETSQSIEVFVDDEAQANLLLARLVIAGVPVHAFWPATGLIEQTYNVLSGIGPQPAQPPLLEQTGGVTTAEVEIPEQPRRRGRRAAHSTDTEGGR